MALEEQSPRKAAVISRSSRMLTFFERCNGNLVQKVPVTIAHYKVTSRNHGIMVAISGVQLEKCYIGSIKSSLTCMSVHKQTIFPNKYNFVLRQRRRHAELMRRCMSLRLLAARPTTQRAVSFDRYLHLFREYQNRIRFEITSILCIPCSSSCEPVRPLYS